MGSGGCTQGDEKPFSQQPLSPLSSRESVTLLVSRKKLTLKTKGLGASKAGKNQ
jgi:hypothetical protein